MRKKLDRVVPVLLNFGDVQSEAGDERAVEIFGLSIRLSALGCHGEFLHP